MFAAYLANATKGATDLQPNYAQIVADAWSSFYSSSFPPSDPTGAQAHEQLGRLLTDGFAAGSTGAALAGLDPASQLAAVQAAFSEAYRDEDCERARETDFNAQYCLCNATQPYLYCNAQLALEASAAIETQLRNAALTVDPGAWGC